MPTCTNCGRHVEHLLAIYCRYVTEDFRIVDGAMDYGDVYDDRDEYALDGYACPECGEMLFDSESEAEAFLKGEMEVENDA